MPDMKLCESYCWRPRLIVTDLWQTCEKIRAAVYRGGLDLWSYFRQLDPNDNCLISEAQFVSILAGPLKETLGLTANEISQLTDYFRVYDGRIYYSQFCEIIHSNVPNICQNPERVTGLEWTEPYKVCKLNTIEELRVRMLLTKIATLVNRRHLVLQPYSQDYELITKSAGVVTKNHFARVLTYLNIKVSAEEFQLLVKKFSRDSYTVNYVAFIGALDDIIRALREQGVLDVGGDVLPYFPGRALSAQLPILPQPELTILDPKPNVNPGPKDPPVRPAELLDSLRRIQCFLLKNRICPGKFFRAFDLLNCGRVSEAQFRRSLDKMTAEAPQRFCLPLAEIDWLVGAYRAPNDPERVCYRTFLEDLSRVLTAEDIEKCCKVQESAPLASPKDFRHVERQPGRDICERTLAKIKLRVRERGLHLKPSFTCYDPKHSGHVTLVQMRQALIKHGMLLTDEELLILETRFIDDMGFNYLWFLEEVAPRDPEERVRDQYGKKLVEDRKPFPYPMPTVVQRDVVEILAKIKCKIVRENIDVLEPMLALDLNKEGHISRECFCQGIDECGFPMTACEMDTLMDAFGADGRPDRVDYKRFASAVHKAVQQPCHERAPLIAPMEQILRPDNCRNFLNFDERYLVGRALQTLSELPYMNLEELFGEHDHCHAGLITPAQFRCVMFKNGLFHLLSTRQVQALIRCFGVKRTFDDDFDYRAFCHALGILQVNRRRRVL